MSTIGWMIGTCWLYAQLAWGGLAVAARHPEIPGLQMDLANTYHNLAKLHADAKELLRGRREEAESAMKAALAIQQRLVEKHPGVPDYQNDLATTWNNLAVLHAEQPEGLAESEAAYKTALEVRTRLAREHFYVTQYQQEAVAAG